MTEFAVSFALKSDLPPERQQAIRATISWIHGVASVVPLAPDHALPQLRAFGTAVLDSGADPESVARAIASLDGVEYAEVAAQRGLLD